MQEIKQRPNIIVSKLIIMVNDKIVKLGHFSTVF